MTEAAAVGTPVGGSAAAGGRTSPRIHARQVYALAGFMAITLLLVVLWEGVKFLGGDPWDFPDVLGSGVAFQHVPPFHWTFANDINLPHVWDVLAAFGATDANGETLLQGLLGAAFFTFRGAAVGFFLGATVGLGLAILLIHVRVLERGLVPILVASQTVPIIAIAPVVVVGLKAGWFGIAVVASYLTFFPVTIAAIRGMRSADPRAFELMRSYAARDRAILWKLRLPASPPYLFTAFKISATASVVGAIVGELPSGIRDGLGGSLLQAMQYYTLSPATLFAGIIVAAGLGIFCFSLVVLAEHLVMRSYPPAESAA